MRSVSKSRHAAFSLVEVTMALGLAAFAVVAVMGVLPTGLATLRDSLDEVSEANLFREFAGKASRSSFTDLNKIAGDPVYFSEQGLAVTNEADARFKVDLTVSDALLPGQSTVSGDTKVVLMTITRLPGSHTTTRPVYVAKSGF